MTPSRGLQAALPCLLALLLCAQGCGGDEGPTAAPADLPDGSEAPPSASAPVYVDHVNILGAYPAIKGTSVDPTKVWQRACAGEAPDGFLLNIGMVTTPRGGSGEDLDRDRGVHPGDLIGSARRGVLDCASDTLACGAADQEIQMEGAALSLSLECLEAYETGGAGDACTGGAGAPAVVQMSHKAHLAPSGQRTLAETARDEGHNVIFLVDYSGSLHGMVDADTLQEDLDPLLATNPGGLASDPNDARLSALAEVISGHLNPKDRVGVVAYGEGIAYSGMKVPCAEAVETPSSDLATCFGTDHQRWMDEDSGFPAIPPGAGRANLWEAVSLAYDFLRNATHGHEPQTRGNHIVVLTDGPDTSSYSEELGACQSGEAEIAAEDLLKEIADEDIKAGGVDVAMHFVQFEARGYVGPDPRQQEAACATGGHHRFIDSEALSPGGDQLGDAILEALLSIRHAWTGSWQIPVEDAPFAGLEAGSIYALSGSVAFDESLCLSETDGTCEGREAGIGAEGSWDKRPLVRRPCVLGADCGGPEAEEGSCHRVCSPETGLCPGGAFGYDLRDGAPCFDGGPGNCCAGTCVVGFCEGCL